MSKNLFTPLIAFIMCLASCSFVSKDFDASDKDSLIIQLITYVLDQAHYLDKDINDDFSEKVFDTFLENLDPYKRYFYASDIYEFSKYKHSIDDAFKNPNLDFFDLVHERYSSRMLESEKIFNDILSKPFDFSKDEICECDFEVLDYVKTKDELYDRWRKLLKIYVIENYHNEIEDDLRKQEQDPYFKLRKLDLIEKETRDALNETMNQNFRFISEEMQRSDWFSVYINSFVSQYDPNTSYLDPESKDRFDVDMSGNYAGIGARLQKKIDKVEITEVISGGQALVSEPIKPCMDVVVMANTVLGYMSQSDKGEMVIGGGTDGFNNYTQRGSFHHIEETVRALVETFPMISRLKMPRQWGGIVDVTGDRSPILSKTPVEGVFVNCGWGTGGFKAIPGSGWAMAELMAKGQSPLTDEFSMYRFREGKFIDESVAAGVAH